MQSDAALAYTLAFLYTPATPSASASRKADDATTFQNYFFLRISFFPTPFYASRPQRCYAKLVKQCTAIGTRVGALVRYGGASLEIIFCSACLRPWRWHCTAAAAAAADACFWIGYGCWSCCGCGCGSSRATLAAGSDDGCRLRAWKNSGMLLCLEAAAAG